MREDHELTGPHGHVPGTLRYPHAKIGDLRTLLPRSTAVVLACDDGRRSGDAPRPTHRRPGPPTAAPARPQSRRA